jgi:hypothetical protein
MRSSTAAPAGDEAGGPRARASATHGVKCRGVPTSHAGPAPGIELGAMKAPMSRASQSEQSIACIGSDWLCVCVWGGWDVTRGREEGMGT